MGNKTRENDTQKFERVVGECLATLKGEKREYKSAATASKLTMEAAISDNKRMTISQSGTIAEKREYKSAATLESELKRTSATDDNVLRRLSRLVDHQEGIIRHHLGDKDAETAKRCVAALEEIYMDLQMTISHELEGV